MRVQRERIQLTEGQSFRVLRWTRTLRRVESVLGDGRVELLAGEGAHWHYHTEMELTLFTDGEGTRFVGDHIGPFSAGDLVLLGSRLPHYWHTRGPSAGISVQWDFPPQHALWAFPETQGWAALFQQAARGLRLCGRSAQEMAEAVRALPAALSAGRLAGLLGVLARLEATPPENVQTLSRRSFALPAAAPHQKAMREAVRHLVGHFREEVRLEEVLVLAGLSRPTFARQFKQHTGRSFSEFLNHLRLQAVCHELAHSSRSVSEIALACGFTQISFFNRLFRRVLGRSPSEYRKRVRPADR